jgi:flagellar basal-body rod protein FlgG
MMRSLWTAASGMKAQQFNVDVISNNLSNVNTTGFKKERVEFKDILYETIESAYNVNGTGQPVSLQVGHGAVAIATVKNFLPGNFERTDNPLDFAIDGNGFFAVEGPKGDVVYTRDGSFKITVNENGKQLTTADGFPVLDDFGNPIYFDVDLNKINVSPQGGFSYVDEDGVAIDLGFKLGLVKFENINGLESMGGNFYVQTSASGQPLINEDVGKLSTVQQFFLESSNVQVVEEMVKLIVAQRAYELSSKAIQTSDEMLSLANNLKR